MNIEKKLKNLPHIYYLNLDHDRDRRVYMETQFEQLKIKNFTRVSGSNFLAENIDEWSHVLKGNYTPDRAYLVGNFVSHISLFREWLKNTNDEYLIIMEDDYDMSLMDYWHFSWEELMQNLPSNWDCIQLGYEHDVHVIFCLHFKPLLEHFFGPCLLNRTFVKKLVKLYYQDEKYVINSKLAFPKNQLWQCPYSVDTAIISDGVTYRLPLITTNVAFARTERSAQQFFHKDCASTYHYWWKVKKQTINLDNFFVFSPEIVDCMALSVKDYSEYL